MGGKKKGKVVDLWKVVGERKVWYNPVEMAISIQSHRVSHYCTPLAFSSFFFFDRQFFHSRPQSPSLPRSRF